MAAHQGVFHICLAGRRVSEDWSLVESVYGGLYRAELDEFFPGLRTYWGELSP